jgi:hypothetical protein
MKRRGGMDLSLVNHREKEKKRIEEQELNRKKGEGIKKHRNLIQAIVISFVFGAGTGGVLNYVKIPIDGPESPKIPLIQKFKYEINDWWKGVGNKDSDKTQEKIETPKEQKNDSKIHIEIDIPDGAGCDEDDKQGCLVS